MSAIYDRTCTTCGHKINDHDANECWKTADGKQCECGWMRVEGASTRQRSLLAKPLPNYEAA